MKNIKDINHYNYRLGKLKDKRLNYDPKWDELSIFCDPRNSYFKVKKSNGDFSQLIPKTDDTVQLHLPLYAAIMNSMLTPQAYTWHQMKFFDTEVQTKFGDFLSNQNELLFSYRYSGQSNFLQAMNESYLSIVVFGHAIMEFTKDRKRKRVNYRTLPIKEFYIDKDYTGRIDTFYRDVEMSYRNLKQMFPGYVPEKFKGRDDVKWLDDTVELVHSIEPSDIKSGDYTSTYIDISGNQIIEQTEMDYCPYLCVRASVFPSSDDPYGFSPCMSILPSIKALNSLQFNFIKQTDQAGQPTLLTNSDIIDATKVAASGTVIEGGIDEEGRPMVQALKTGADYPALDYEIKMLQDKIKQALFINFFQSFSDTQSRSATDAMLKANEKANLIAPAGDRIARELLIPMIELELKLYGDLNMLPTAPDELVKSQLGTEFDIVLDNPLLKGQRMDSANNIMTLAGYMATLGGIQDPTLNKDRAIRTLQNVLNVPKDIVNTPDEINKANEEMANAADASAMVEAAPAMADAVKKLAETKQIMNNGGV